MQISSSAAPLAEQRCDLIVLGVRDGALADTVNQKLADLHQSVVAAATEDDFSGKAATAVSYPTLGQLPSGRVALVGLGGGSQDELRRAAGKAAHLARSRGSRTLAMDLGPLSAADAGAVIEGATAGNYRFDRYKAEAERKAPLSSLILVGEVDLSGAGAAQAVSAAQALARDLVNEQPELMYPETLAQAAVALQGQGLSVEVWDEVKIKAEGMGGITAVGQGSDRPARFIHLIYRPQGTPRRKVGLVGKGVTFDSGGLSLKPSSGMQTMRCDMSGSAAVLGVMQAVRALQPDVEVHGFIGAVENMNSGYSYKLGDVLRMYNGKTVEIHNTDAEGRLVLADCLAYASKLGLDEMVDIATLTGACVVALGDAFVGLFTPNDAVAGELLTAASAAGEPMWRMPMPDYYKEQLKADWGGIKNVGGREGGAITAALFLAEFVENTPWAHLDIAGPAFYERGFRHYAPGGSGSMVQTLTRWATR